MRRILSSLPEPALRTGILAHQDTNAELQAKIAELRRAGERVVVEFAGQVNSPIETGCDRKLARVAEAWQVVPL